MSFGKNKSKSSSSQQSSSQQTLDPQVKAALLSNYAQAKQLASNPFVPYSGELVAPVNATQNAGINGILGLESNNPAAAAMNAGISTLRGVANEQPLAIDPFGYTAATGSATSAGPASLATASQIDPNNVLSIDAPNISAADIEAFLNPFMGDVVGTTANEMALQEGITQAQNAAKATEAGAFGGSGYGVMQALENRNFQNALGSTVAGLESSGFSTALSAAQQQAAQRLAAAEANQSTKLSAGSTNATLANAVALANAEAQNSQSQFNAGQANQFGQFNLSALNQAGQFNAGQVMDAQKANEAAREAFAQLALNAGSGLGTLSNDQLNQLLGINSAALSAGGVQQQTQQALDTAQQQQYMTAQQWPIIMQELVNQSLGLMGNPVLGSSQSSGKSSGSSSGFSFGIPFPSSGGGSSG